ncbi:hypothetical protein GPECTOR_9g631 [Gonium pectorale]|uniref:PH domain-containing protein n=1 Tax=Gonium pectorale TaxID=33097 RepID=A0A150GRU5_GONPE|nr:hypothetical protein GPECTOR_9g631 [Gonium pectorale]|eukprot:KXZ52586.1 hypothetical protein GPECTOR_9g631 [Gonium pectorale]
MPPASYMWLWLGNFKRWGRRYFVASEAPGVLLIYKRSNMQGKVWSTSLMGATVVQDESNPRQIQLITPAGTIFLRVLRPEERKPWVACLNESIAAYRKHKEVVERVAAEGGEATAGVASALPTVGGAAAAVEHDADQRRRIRQRTADRMAELAPLVGEVERHLGVLGSQLAGMTAGLGQLGQQPLLPLTSHAALSNALSVRATRPPAVSATNLAADYVAGSTAAASPRDSPSAPSYGAVALETAAAAASGGVSPAATPPGRLSLAGRRGELNVGPAAAANGGEREGGECGALERPVSLGLIARSRSRGRAAPGQVLAPQAPNLVSAVGALVDAVRATLHNEAVRITNLEAENAALNKALDILRSSTHRAGGRSRGVSGPGLGLGGGGYPVGPASGGQKRASGSIPAAAVASAAGDGGSEAGSACTADEDAFDVVEAFDEGVDYSILDDDNPHVHRMGGVVADDDEAPYAQHGSYPGAGTEEEDDDEEAEEEEAALAQRAEVLNALEVVRQVEYIAAAGGHGPLLAADAPPPPDAEEEEEEDRRRGKGGKGGRAASRPGAGERRTSGKGEELETDATLEEEDEDDEDDSETAVAAAPSPRRPYEGRCRLPAPKPLGRGFSIWGILKQAIGGDLTRITMPATINEPLSMTQRLAEPLANRSLLERAACCPDPLERLMLVSVWLLAGHNSQPLRDNKPFNPLLGETFEWQAYDGSARYISEQVSHHPPVSCFVADGGGPQGYELYGEVETKTKFWGKAIDCILAGHMSVRLKAFDEEYRLNLGSLVINDIILGRFWVDCSCDLKIRNQRTGDTARLIIKPCRGYAYLDERGAAEGCVRDATGKEVWRISGSVQGSLYAALTPEAAAARGASTAPQLVWSPEPDLPNPHEQYFMTQ